MKREPAFWIGFIFAAILAVLQVANGSGLIGSDVLATIQLAIDPDNGGWLLPIVIGIVTRFFVTPATRIGW